MASTPSSSGVSSGRSPEPDELVIEGLEDPEIAEESDLPKNEAAALTPMDLTRLFGDSSDEEGNPERRRRRRGKKFLNSLFHCRR